MKWTALVIWGVAFWMGLGVLLVRSGVPEATTTAAKPMPANHLLHLEDFRKGPKSEAFVGRYLRRTVVAGEKLMLHDVSYAPLLSSESEPWFAVAAPAMLIKRGTIESKTKGQICRDTDVFAPAEVVAVFCSPPDEGTSCLALVRLTSADATKFASLLASRPAPTDILFKPSCK